MLVLLVKCYNIVSSYLLTLVWNPCTRCGPTLCGWKMSKYKCVQWVDRSRSISFVGKVTCMWSFYCYSKNSLSHLANEENRRGLHSVDTDRHTVFFLIIIYFNKWQPSKLCLVLLIYKPRKSGHTRKCNVNYKTKQNTELSNTLSNVINFLSDTQWV